MADIDGTSMADRLPDGVEQAKAELDTAWNECGITAPFQCAEAFKEAVEYTGVVALDAVVEAVAPKYGSSFEQGLDRAADLDKPPSI